MIDLQSPQCLDALHERGHLGALDVHFAKALGRLGGERRPEVLLAVSLVSRQVSAGHVCLQLADLSARDLGIPVDELVLPETSAWRVALGCSPLVYLEEESRGGACDRPLVLDASGRLYLQRYWQHERALADFIGAGSAPEGGSDGAPVERSVVDEALLSQGLERLFPASTGSGHKEGTEPDWQRQAAVMAVRQRFCVVSGGPGTGKTFTVVKILALLVEQALGQGQRVPQILLVAPTGKAATRLEASIRGAKARLDCSEAVRAAIVDKASTLHRCLGSVRGSTSVFRHNRDAPLVADVVLVDEASMVNLGLMRRLTDALPPGARLILLGDMDQLASVEAGAVLGDICNTGGRKPGKIPPTGIANCVVKLQKSYRYSSDSGIAALAQAINRGDAQGALEVLSRGGDVALVPPGTRGQLSRELYKSAVEGYRAALSGGTPAERLISLDTFRVLCARRSGSFGVEAVNELLVQALLAEGLVVRPVGSENFEGRPVMITANSYDLSLFNGDIGMVLSSQTDRAALTSLRVFFVDPDGSQRSFSPARLAHQETVLAMSVHKSQGSEFDEVAVVLPDEPSRVLTRELLYTGVTRAKKRVVLHGTPELIRQCVVRRTKRESGLRAALWGEEPRESP